MQYWFDAWMPLLRSGKLSSAQSFLACVRPRLKHCEEQLHSGIAPKSNIAPFVPEERASSWNIQAHLCVGKVCAWGSVKRRSPRPSSALPAPPQPVCIGAEVRALLLEFFHLHWTLRWVFPCIEGTLAGPDVGLVSSQQKAAQKDESVGRGCPSTHGSCLCWCDCFYVLLTCGNHIS